MTDTRPFCSNETCLLNHHVVDDEQTDLDVVFPNGASFNVKRIGLSWPNGGFESLCDACHQAFEMVKYGKHIKRDPPLGSPHFCGNTKCWLQTVEVDGKEQTELTIHDGESHADYTTSRNDFDFPGGKTKKLCQSCTGSIRYTLNPLEWPEPFQGEIVPGQSLVH